MDAHFPLVVRLVQKPRTVCCFYRKTNECDPFCQQRPMTMATITCTRRESRNSKPPRSNKTALQQLQQILPHKSTVLRNPSTTQFLSTAISSHPSKPWVGSPVPPINPKPPSMAAKSLPTAPPGTNVTRAETHSSSVWTRTALSMRSRRMGMRARNVGRSYRSLRVRVRRRGYVYFPRFSSAHRNSMMRVTLIRGFAFDR